MAEFSPFKEKIWLSTPTMHGPELDFVTEAYKTNWMSTVGANINEVEADLRKSRLQACSSACYRHVCTAYGS